jgi:hypothetical protein
MVDLPLAMMKPAGCLAVLLSLGAAACSSLWLRQKMPASSGDPAHCMVWLAAGKQSTGAPYAVVEGEESKVQAGDRSTVGPVLVQGQRIEFQGRLLGDYHNGRLVLGPQSAAIGPPRPLQSSVRLTGKKGDADFSFSSVCRDEQVALGVAALATLTDAGAGLLGVQPHVGEPLDAAPPP